MGPDLMAEMRAQAERFGTEIIRGHVTESRCRAPDPVIDPDERVHAAGR